MDSTLNGHAGHAPHVLSPAALLGTAGALLALTAFTVAVAHLDLGRGNVIAALAVATVKAGLVAAIFMHLRHGRPFHLVVLVGAVLFAALLAGFVLVDTTLYQPDIRAHDAAEAARSR